MFNAAPIANPMPIIAIVNAVVRVEDVPGG